MPRCGQFGRMLALYSPFPMHESHGVVKTTNRCTQLFLLLKAMSRSPSMEARLTTALAELHPVQVQPPPNATDDEIVQYIQMGESRPPRGLQCEDKENAVWWI